MRRSIGRSGAGPRLTRGIRAVTVAVMSTVLTAVGHVAAGGAAPDLALLLVLFPLFALLVVTLADAGRTVPRLLGTLGAGQLGMHVLMQVLAHQHSMEAASGAMIDGSTMLAMHVVATLGTAWMICNADDGLLALFTALARVLPRRLMPPPADRPLPTLPVPAHAVALHIARAATSGLVRRGPPVWA